MQQYEYYMQTGDVIGAAEAELGDETKKDAPAAIPATAIGVSGTNVPWSTEVFKGMSLARMFDLNKSRYAESWAAVQADMAYQTTTK